MTLPCTALYIEFQPHRSAGLSIQSDTKNHSNADHSSGASIARHSGRANSRERHEPVRRCELEYESETVEELLGYDVTYRYHGAEFTKRTDHHPGDRIRIDVDVRPAYASR